MVKRYGAAVQVLVGTMLLTAVALGTGSLWVDVRNEAMATGQMQIGVLDSSETNYLWRQTYSRSDDTVLFYMHLLSYFAMALMFACGACLGWLIALTKLVGGPEARPTGKLLYIMRAVTVIAGLAALHWVVFFWLFRFGFGEALGLVNPAIGAGPR